MIVATNGHDHGAHEQGGGEIVGQRRDEKGQAAREPEQLAQAEATAHHPGTQGIEHQPVFHGIDIGHGHQQEQHELGVFQQIAPRRLLGGVGHAMNTVFQCDHAPDDAGGQDHRLGFTQLGEFLGHDQGIGGNKDEQGEIAYAGAGEVEAAATASGIGQLWQGTGEQ